MIMGLLAYSKLLIACTGITIGVKLQIHDAFKQISTKTILIVDQLFTLICGSCLLPKINTFTST